VRVVVLVLVVHVADLVVVDLLPLSHLRFNYYTCGSYLNIVQYSNISKVSVQLKLIYQIGCNGQSWRKDILLGTDWMGIQPKGAF
jgi:hypothetical protein